MSCRKAYFPGYIGKLVCRKIGFRVYLGKPVSPQGMIHREIKAHKSLHGAMSAVLQFGSYKGSTSTAK